MKRKMTKLTGWAVYRVAAWIVSYMAGYIIAFLWALVTGMEAQAVVLGTVLGTVLGLIVDYAIFSALVDRINPATPTVTGRVALQLPAGDAGTPSNERAESIPQDI